MSRISINHGTASVDLAAAMDELRVNGKRTVMYLPRDLLTATEQALRAIGTAEGHALANAVAEVGQEAVR